MGAKASKKSDMGVRNMQIILKGQLVCYSADKLRNCFQ